MWFIFTLAGYGVAAVVGVLDKFILAAKRTSPRLFTFYSTVTALPVFLLLFFGVNFLSGIQDWVLAIISGFCFSLGLWSMYWGLEEGEISHIGPLIGGSVPLFILIFSHSFLGENLPSRALSGVLFLAFGSILVAFEYSRGHYAWHRSAWWGVLSAFFFAVSHVTAKYLYGQYDFFTGLIWTKGMMGVFGLLFLLWPSFWREFLKRPKKQKKVVTQPQRSQLFLVAADKILGIVSLVLVQYAVALYSATVVMALAGVQFALLLLLVAWLSRYHKKLFREEYSRLEIIQEIVAIILIGIGLVLVV